MNLPEAAAFIAQQWPCFPCNAEKRPVTAHGLKDAVSNPEEARRLFRKPGAAMIGVPTGAASGLVVVDLDCKDGAAGLEWHAANQHRIPETRQHRTRSGGKHLLFQYPVGRTIRNSASKIAPGVDVRGEGGYIIAPPSAGYSIETDAMPAPLPDWLLELLDPPAPPPRPAAPPRRLDDASGTPYGQRALSDECDAILAASFGVQETTLNNAALKIGALVAGGELAHGYAREALVAAGMGMPSQGGKPSWSPVEIRNKVERGMADGARSPRNAPPREVRHTVRVEIVPPEPPPRDEPPDWAYAEPVVAADAVEQPAPQLRREAPTPAPWPTLSLDEIAALPPPSYIIDKVLVEASNALLIGPWASLKSFLALDWSLSVAYGFAWQGREVRQTGVLYVAGEGVGGIGRRIIAWRHHMGVEDKPAPFRLLGIGVNITDDAQVRKLVLTALAAAEAEGQPIGLIIIDTLARAMIGADENAAADMGKAIRALDEIRTDARVCTLTVHHMGKDKDRGARGSSALPAAADTEITVSREESRLTITITKQKDDEEGEPLILKAIKVGVKGGEPIEGEPTSLVLVADDEGAQSSSRPSGRLSGDQSMAFRILNDTLAQSGEPGFAGVPPGLVSIPEDWWRERFYDRAKPGADRKTKEKAFRRAADALIAAAHVAIGRGRVWSCK